MRQVAKSTVLKAYHVESQGAQHKIAGGFFTSSSLYFLSNILNALIPFFLLPLLTRYLAPEEYGLVSIFQALTTGLLAFVGLNTVGAALRQFYDESSRPRLAIYIGACFKVLLVTTLITLGVMLIFQNMASELTGLSLKWLLLAVLASAGLFAVNMRLGQWQVKGEALKYGSLQISVGAMNAVVTLVLVVLLGMGADGRMAGILVAPLLMGCIAVYLLRRDGLLSAERDQRSVRNALEFGVPLAPHVIGLFLLTAGDRFVINRLLGADAVGIYMVAMQMAMGIGLAFDAFNKAFVPWLFARLKRGDPAELRRVVIFTYACFIGAFILAGLLALAGPILVYVLAGKEYHGALKYLGLLAFGQAFQGLYLMVTNYAFFAKRTGLLSSVTIFSGMLGIALLWLMVPSWGLSGAAMAYLITMAIRFLLTWVLAQYCHPMPWLSFYKY
jgi:O-antigen/teichoic acid export membrane protein